MKMRFYRTGFASIALLALLTGTSNSGFAHSSSNGFLKLTLNQKKIFGQIDLSLRDLEFEFSLDVDGDLKLTWAEILAKERVISDYVLSRITVMADGSSCHLSTGSLSLNKHVDEIYAVVPVSIHCDSPPHQNVTIGYRIFFDLDADHRGLLSFVTDKGQQSGVFSPDRIAMELPLGRAIAPTLMTVFQHYTIEGLYHIFSGIDHLLFLLCMLLGVVFPRTRCLVAPFYRHTVIEVTKVVSSFTLAHSLTLAIVSLDLWRPPSQAAVELLIALSVVVSAANVLRPVVKRTHWAIAFMFGLIHGLGFASVLTDLSLSGSSLVQALLAFNIGIETGQLVIVILVLIPAFWVCARPFGDYCRVALASFALIVGTAWFVERIGPYV